jgi:hypothetical protein
MSFSKIKFETYLRKIGFEKHIHKISNIESLLSVSQYKVVGDHIIICRFLSKMYYSLDNDTFEIMRIPKQSEIIDYKMLNEKQIKSNPHHVKLDNISDLNEGCDFFKIYYCWDEFEPSLKYILRDTRLNNIIDKNNNIKNGLL